MGRFIKEKAKPSKAPSPASRVVELRPAQSRKPDPMKIKDRDEAEKAAQHILESFGQSDKKLKDNLAQIMKRWDDLHGGGK